MKISAKTLFYNENGTGRDTYISINSGGLSPGKQVIPEPLVSSFRGRRLTRGVVHNSSNKVAKYVSNGSGRDTYIMNNSGGFERGSKMLRLEGSLRTYTRDPHAVSYWIKETDRIRLRKIKLAQERLIKRLYPNNK